MIIAFGVAWRANSAAAAVVKSPKNYMTPAAFDSLTRYARPVTVTAGRRTRDPVELLAREDYYAQPDVGGGFGDVGRAAPAAPRWVVSAIMITGEQRMAIVNNVVVQGGSTLSGGARVIEIESDRVVLQEAGGKRITVPLNR